MPELLEEDVRTGGASVRFRSPRVCEEPLTHV